MVMDSEVYRSKNSWFAVDEEYTSALRTKSYVDLYAKVHGRIEKAASTTAMPDKDDDSELPKLHHSRSSPIPFPYDNHLIPDFLLDPSQESLLNAADTNSSKDDHFHRKLNTLLLDFFEATLQACLACSSLLSSIERARSHHRSIHRLLFLTRSTSSAPSSFSQLSSHLELGNPLSPESLSHFNLIHSRYPPLIRRLTSAHRKIVRRQKMLRWVQKASGLALVALFGAVVVSAIIVATHAVVAVAVVPIAAAAGAGRKKKGKIGRWLKGWMRLETARARMDVAAKGAYIVGRDLDTMSAIVRRVHDEVEHGRDVARMVVRNKEWQMVKEVVKEMEGRGEEVGMGLEEQLEELEEHVYLCLTTINRSRRLVAEEMMQPPPEIVVV